MANAIYPIWKQEVVKATANTALNSTNVRAALIDTGTYTYSAAHDFYNDLSGIVGPARGSQPGLANRTYTNGTLDADDITYTALSGTSVEALVLYIDTGSDATSVLFAYIDTSVTGMPFTPSGGDITVQWNASGIITI